MELNHRFIYVTRDGEEQNSRPHKAYTYSLQAEIFSPSNKSEEKTLVFNLDLIFARLGKTAYRTVANKTAQLEVNETFKDLLGQIKEIGFDALCSEE